MNVLIVSEGYPPDGGGVATSAARIAKNLASCGCRVVVVTYDRARSYDFISPQRVDEDEAVTVVRIGPLLPVDGATNGPAAIAKQKASLRRRFVDHALNEMDSMAFSPDIVFSMYLLNAGFLATFLAKRLKVPHVAGIRGNDIGRNLFEPESLYATSFVLDHADAIVSVNAHLKDRTLDAFPRLSGKTLVVPNAIDAVARVDRAAARRELVERTGWPSDSLILCFNGAFREKKGAFEILAAFGRLQDEGSRARLLIVGDATGAVERAAAGPLLDRLVRGGTLVTTGQVERSAVPRLIAAADVLLMPSLDDGLANGLLEGMACGLCPLVSALFADTVDNGRTGLVLDRVTPERIVGAIRSLDADREATAGMGDAAQRAAAGWSPRQEAGSYLALFTRLLAAGRADGGADSIAGSGGAVPCAA